MPDFSISSHLGTPSERGLGWDAGGAREHARPPRACSVARAAPRSSDADRRAKRRSPPQPRERQEVKWPRRATAAAEREAAEGALRRRRRRPGRPRELSAGQTRPLGSRTPRRAGWITTSWGLAATRCFTTRTITQNRLPQSSRQLPAQQHSLWRLLPQRQPWTPTLLLHLTAASLWTVPQLQVRRPRVHRHLSDSVIVCNYQVFQRADGLFCFITQIGLELPV